MRSEVDVVVVGAGVAGLAAAGALARAGRSAEVLEARDRIGGRILTTRQPGMQLPVELGAEFVHGSRAVTIRLASEAGLLVTEVHGEHWRSRHGSFGRVPDFWGKVRGAISRLDPNAPDRPVIEAISDIAGDLAEDERRLLLEYIQGFHAADPARMGTRALAEAEGAGRDDDDDSDRQLRIPSGYDRIVSHLAVAFPGSVRLQTVVERITWSAGSARVEARFLASGETLTIDARAAIITVPLGVLKAEPPAPGAIHFDPPVRAISSAAARLEMGFVVRVAVRLREPIWSTGQLRGPGGVSLSRLSFLHADAPIPVWWTPAPLIAPLLVGWCGGPPARALATPGRSALTALVREVLAEHLRLPAAELEKELISITWHDWQADPYSRGAYSYVPVNAQDAQQTLARPLNGTLFFAGEACAAGDNGTVHGAIESGWHAAEQVLSSS